MRILVTGSAGFIGFHVAKRLLDFDHEVIGLDNFNDYYAPELKEAREAILEAYRAYSPNRLDLCDRPGLERLFAGAKPDIVVHLAAQAGVRYSLVNPYAYQKSNMEGFLNLIEIVRSRGMPRFIYASSSSVYAGLKRMPYRESQRTDRPQSLYAATKLANELIARNYTYTFGLQTIGLRFFTVYGPWGRPDMALWIFVDRIANGSKVQIYNHGRMKRDFTYIDDVVTGVIDLIGVTDIGDCEIFNIGNSRSENLMDFVAVIEKALGRKADIEFLPLQPGDVVATYADISKLQAAAGFEPKTPISEGIPKFIAWYLAHPDLAKTVRESRRNDR